MAETDGVTAYGLLDSLDMRCLKLPMAAVKEVGPAAETLGAILYETNGSTFKAQKNIAADHRITYCKFKRHVGTLSGAGWIINGDRTKPRKASNGRPRRTNTITIPSTTKARIEPYGILPWWANVSAAPLHKKAYERPKGRLSWTDKVLLSVVMGQLAKMRSVAEQHDAEIEDMLGDYFADSNWRWTFARLHEHTGLDGKSIVSAKQCLHKLGIIDIQDDEYHRDDGGYPAQLLVPNLAFQIHERPSTREGYVYYDFGG